MNKLKKTITHYFNLSRKESNGFIFLCIIVLVIIFIPPLYQSFFSKKQDLLDSDKKHLDSLLLTFDKSQKNNERKYARNEKIANSIFYSTFNPNSSSEETMTAAGVPSYVSKRIVKFRSKGGKFFIKEDIKKIYGLKEQDFKKLYPFIDLPEKRNRENNYNINNERQKNTSNPFTKNSFDLNTADSIQLISIKGIGPVFASRILKYRKKLGGFISLGQIKDVFGLDSLAIAEINSRTIISSNFKPSQININSANLNLLATHPYIGRKIAQLIINYRLQHGNYSSSEQLKNIKLITEENYVKMLPYLSLE